MEVGSLLCLGQLKEKGKKGMSIGKRMGLGYSGSAVRRRVYECALREVKDRKNVILEGSFYVI